MADLVSQLQSAGEESTVIKNLQSAFNDFAKAAEEGKAQLRMLTVSNLRFLLPSTALVFLL